MNQSLLISYKPVLLPIGALVIFFAVHFVLVATKPDTTRIAHDIVEVCRNEKDHAVCYESEVPALYPKVSVSDIFAVIRAVRAEDPTYQFCHVLAHKVGERVVAEDPNKWIEAIPENPSDGLCSNGFIHGVTGGRFRSEVLTPATIEQFLPDFTRACVPRPGWQPSDLDRAICYHGMGHLFDFITNADIPAALSLCSKITPPEFPRVCIEGVFMQIYQPLEPDDFVLIDQMSTKPTKTTVRSYCAQFTDPRYVGACLRESWPMFRTEIMDGSGVVAFCSGQPNAEQADNCFNATATIIGRMNLGSPDQAAAACNKFPSVQQEGCFTVVAQAILEEDRTNASGAVSLCRQGGATLGDHCISDLVRHATFLFGGNTVEFNNFCNAIPSADLKQTCVANKDNASR